MAIGVDLNGTLAFYTRGQIDKIGPAVPSMLDLVHDYVAAGEIVKIITARVGRGDPDNFMPEIERWLEEHGLGGLEVTAERDRSVRKMYDDRSIGVELNTGRLCEECTWRKF